MHDISNMGTMDKSDFYASFTSLESNIPIIDTAKVSVDNLNAGLNLIKYGIKVE
ncbi:MAG: hypothetical protein NTV63_00450 [Candidatus Woesearchaeota archaeon]|nr:hypothetical protein [Candidatus Woesearchaeota archaeon]